jgi:hypothetical protein
MLRSKVAKIAATFALVATLGAATLATAADAGPANCFRGVGGTWYCSR